MSETAFPPVLIFLDKISPALNNHAEMKEKNTIRAAFIREVGTAPYLPMINRYNLLREVERNEKGH